MIGVHPITLFARGFAEDTDIRERADRLRRGWLARLEQLGRLGQRHHRMRRQKVEQANRRNRHPVKSQQPFAVLADELEQPLSCVNAVVGRLTDAGQILPSFGD